MEPLDYKKLYLLQDEILERVFREYTDFYLTGGTCLNRFYFEKRYSDDLDLFTNIPDTFSQSAREIIDRISAADYEIEKQVDSKDFIRIHIVANEVLLQVDFVNDRVKRFGEIHYKNGCRIDNLQNILSNKITAIISRDNPKDIFDLYLIAQNTSFRWSEILAQAKEKLHFQKEDLLYRMKTFPSPLLKKLNTTDEQFLHTFETDFINIINQITLSG